MYVYCWDQDSSYKYWIYLLWTFIWKSISLHFNMVESLCHMTNIMIWSCDKCWSRMSELVFSCVYMAQGLLISHTCQRQIEVHVSKTLKDKQCRLVRCVKCSDCGKDYIGETTRPLGVKIQRTNWWRFPQCNHQSEHTSTTAQQYTLCYVKILIKG